MPQTVKLALLDDYQKVAMRMADWEPLKKRGVEITVFHEPFKSVDDAAKKLAPFQAHCRCSMPMSFPTKAATPSSPTCARLTTRSIRRPRRSWTA